MQYRIIFIIGFFILFNRVTAQPPGKYSVQYFNTDNGLPSNGIKGLQWDAQTGFLWIATEAGIVRYNGLEFKNYSKEDEPHLTNERILFLTKNNTGRIHTSGNSGNIFYIDKNRLVYSGKEKISGNTNSNIIAYAVSDLLKRKSLVNNTSLPFSLQFNIVLPDDDTAAYIVHQNRLYKYSITDTVPRPLNLQLRPVRYGFKIGADFFLLDSLRQIHLFDRHTYKTVFKGITENDLTFSIHSPENRILWDPGMQCPVILNGEKAWILNYDNGKLTARLICDAVPTGELVRYVQYDDKRKILFLGTDSKGIIIIKQNQVATLKKKEPGMNERTSYYAQIPLPDNKILTNEGHIIGLNVTGKEVLPIKSKFLPTIYNSGDSVIWFFQLNPELKLTCLYKYSFLKGETIIFPKIKLTEQTVFTTIGDKLYMANNNNISVLEGDSVNVLYNYAKGADPKLHYDLCEWGQNGLAIATCNALLFFDMQTKRLDTIYQSANSCIRTLWKFKDYLFVGTYGDGLFILKDKKLKPLPLDKNKYLLYTHCFVNDDSGYCWISTNKGLFKAKLDEMIDVYEKNSPAVYYHYFGRNDGMEMTELNGGCTPCAITLKDKTISFPSMDGLLWVNPDLANPFMPDGELFIDAVSADNKFYSPEALVNLELPPKTGELIFKLGFSAWSNYENIYIEYKLNEDGAWRSVDIEKGAEVRFNNLAPGKYKLVIRKRNGFGSNNYSYREINFYIKIPWFKQWWFNLIMLGAIAGIFMVFYNYRTRQLRSNQMKLEKQVAEKTSELMQQNEVLEKNDTIKTRLISIISHDIVTPLKFITVAGKNLIEKRKMMSEELQDETIKEMVNTTQELQLLSTNILNWIKYQNEHRRLAMENFNVYETVEQVTGILKSLANSKKIKLENKVNPDLSLYQYFEPLKIFIYNLIANAINFSENASIIIGAEKENDIVTIWVQDFGVGMTTEQVQRLLADDIIITAANVDNRRGHGLGYLIIKDLVKMMGATLQINSEKGKGTTVSIYIPVDQNDVD
jgi:signal transduction histidine kinase